MTDSLRLIDGAVRQCRMIAPLLNWPARVTKGYREGMFNPDSDRVHNNHGKRDPASEIIAGYRDLGAFLPQIATLNLVTGLESFLEYENNDEQGSLRLAPEEHADEAILGRGRTVSVLSVR